MARGDRDHGARRRVRAGWRADHRRGCHAQAVQVGRHRQGTAHPARPATGRGPADPGGTGPDRLRRVRPVRGPLAPGMSPPHESPVAVVAHARKTLGGGLSELRAALAREGITDPLWFEVNKSRKAPKKARRALEQGAGLIFVWGGDGTVQRCIDAVAGSDAVLAIVPAGTANLLAANLRIPDS